MKSKKAMVSHVELALRLGKVLTFVLSTQIARLRKLRGYATWAKLF